MAASQDARGSGRPSAAGRELSVRLRSKSRLDRRSVAMRIRGLLLALLAIGLTMLGGTAGMTPARAQDAAQIAGTAAVSGIVEAPKPFKAAQVHFLNVDKN